MNEHLKKRLGDATQNFIEEGAKILGEAGKSILMQRLAQASQMAARRPKTPHDPYETLGVDPEMGTDDIRMVYRALVVIYHPDKPTGNETKFKLVTNAWEAIKEERDVK